MTYNQLVTAIAELSGHSTETVKDILYAMPDVLQDLTEGEKVLTPLGTFRAFKSKPRRVVIPNTDKDAQVPAIVYVKFRPGPRLRQAI